MSLRAKYQLSKAVQLTADILKDLIFSGPVHIIIAVVQFAALIQSKEASGLHPIASFKLAQIFLGSLQSGLHQSALPV